MKKLEKDKLIYVFGIFSIIFLLLSIKLYDQASQSRTTIQVEQDRVDVEIIEEEENITEELENEIEGYIEDDMSDLNVQEESIESEEDEELSGQIEENMKVLPLMQRKKNSNEIRIGFMTDLHAKSNSGVSRSDRVIKSIFKERINYFIEEMNNEFIPDFLILNGDVIEGTNRDDEIGSGELRSLRRLFDRTLIPKYWVVGNHDLRAVNKDQWRQSLEIDYLDNSFDIGDYRIIILDTNYDENDESIKPGEYHTRGNVSEDQIEWLKEELDTDKKKLVFMHNPPLWDVDVKSNSGLLLNSLELQDIFSDEKVLAVFSGHIEDFFYDEIDGVKYFVLPGVKKNEKYQGTFAEIGIKNDDIELDVSYIGSGGKYRKINIKKILE